MVVNHRVPSENYEDDVHSFFQNCYHLKDWIKNDAALNLKADVETFVANTICISLCADICNGLKHFKRHTNRSGKEPEFGVTNVFLQVGSREPTIRVKYCIDTNVGSIDAFTLATEYMSEWQAYINAIVAPCAKPTT
jgi:adenosylcobinamide amidohydrolase